MKDVPATQSGFWMSMQLVFAFALIYVILWAWLKYFERRMRPLALLNLVLMGIFMGLYAMREGSIWGISALHSAWNWVQGNFFGFEVSGNSARGGTLINLTETGPDWFTGGTFGPEGGLVVTIFLMIGILVILFWKAKKNVQGNADILRPTAANANR